MIERLSRYVAIRSVSGGEGPLADAVADDLRNHDLATQRVGNNLWCSIGDRPRPRLLLNSHLDTVPPAGGWPHDPWTPRLADGRLSGLGANDAKGCVVALLEAVVRLSAGLRRGQPLGGTVVLALTAEEETSGRGLGTVLDALAPIDAALIGEPTDLAPMIAQRGLLILRCVARGRTAHPANTPPGAARNAIVAAAEDLRRLEAFDWGPPHPLLGRCHAHPTLISGGVARNVIPDACEFTLDVRTTPLEAHAALVERLQGVLRSEVHVHSDRLVPVQTSPDAAIVRAVRAALPDCVPGGSPAMSDMVYLPRTPAVKIGPGQSPRSHTAGEFITLAELSAGSEAYERMVRAYFGIVAAEGSVG